MKESTVYCITNRVNGKCYIGVTKDWKRRWIIHQRADYVIGRALRKYGKENFRISVLYSRIPFATALVLEKNLIAKMDTLRPNGYNVHEGGSGGNTIAGKTDEEKMRTRKKLSKMRKGVPKSEAHKRKISENHADVSGKNHPMWGESHSESTKRKMSEKAKGKYKGQNNPMSHYNKDKRRGQMTLF